jgi:hypothetical protein
MSREPLGTLLVRRGLITNEQLAAALADQRGTGEPLGHILVARGYATPATVALALATQHGGLLKTEYGFATGFETGAVAVADAADPEADRDAVRAELSLAAAETEKLRDDNARLTELRAELEQRLATASQRAASLERELAARDVSIEGFKAVADSWETGLAQRDTRIAELLAARDDALSQLRDTKGALATRDAAVHELTVGRSELERQRDAALEQLRASEVEAAALSSTMSTDNWAAADRHLLFFQGSDGYELVECDGPPPAPGAQVRLENGVQVVARVAGSPTPGARVPCAYLVLA